MPDKEMKHGAIALRGFNSSMIRGKDVKYIPYMSSHEFIKGYYYTTAETKKKAQENALKLIKQEDAYKDAIISFDMNVAKKELKKKVADITSKEASEFDGRLFLSATSIRGIFIDRVKNGFECSICGEKVKVKPYDETIYMHVDDKTYVFCSDDCKELGSQFKLKNTGIDLKGERPGGRASIYLISNKKINKYYVGQTTGTPFYGGSSHIIHPDDSAVGAIVEQYQNLEGGCFEVIEMCDKDSPRADVFERENYGIKFYTDKYGLENMLNRTALKAYENKKAKIEALRIKKEKAKEQELSDKNQLTIGDELPDYERPGAIKE